MERVKGLCMSGAVYWLPLLGWCGRLSRLVLGSVAPERDSLFLFALLLLGQVEVRYRSKVAKYSWPRPCLVAEAVPWVQVTLASGQTLQTRLLVSVTLGAWGDLPHNSLGCFHTQAWCHMTLSKSPHWLLWLMGRACLLQSPPQVLHASLDGCTALSASADQTELFQLFPRSARMGPTPWCGGRLEYPQ